MNKSILEQSIEDWASRNGYPISPRKFYDELQGENQLAQEVGAQKDLVDQWRRIHNIFAKGRGEPEMKEGSPEEAEMVRRKTAIHLPHIDLSWHVLTPRGVLKYESQFRDCILGNPDERAYESHLQRVAGLPDEKLLLYHGPIIPNWKSSKIPVRSRETLDFHARMHLLEGSPDFDVQLINEDSDYGVDTLDVEAAPAILGEKLAKRYTVPFEALKRIYRGGPIPRNSKGYRDTLEAFRALNYLSP